MRRFWTLVALFLCAFPLGLSVTGCVTNVSAFCNGTGYGPKKGQVNSVSISGATTGISLSYGQIGQISGVSAADCTGASLSVGTPGYGSTNLSLVDVNPANGSLCAGTWNRTSAGGIPDFTICTPPSGPGVAQVTATVAGVSSNPVNVYVHPPISSITIPDTGTCYSQSTVQDGLNGDPPPLTAGTVVLGVNGQPIQSQYLGTIEYAAVTPSIVSIADTLESTTAIVNGATTAEQPGSTVVTATSSKVTSSAGYYYTCPPASIALTLNGATGGTVTNGNPQNLNAVITDTKGATITGLSLDYTSTEPQNLSVSTAGALTASFPTTAALTAICQPGTCNPAPLNKIGTLGTGMPVVSNRVTANSLGSSSTLLWAASPQSQYFSAFDLTLNTAASPLKLPYVPNSMVLDPSGTSLYFGSYRELMIYTAATNTLSHEDTTVPGVVLAVSPSGTQVIICDQVRQVIYLYTPAAGTAAGSNISIGGLGTRAVFSPDSKNVYIAGPNAIYIHNATTGWSTYPISSQTGDSTCTFDNLGTTPFCSPDVALTVPAVAPFFSGSNTTARSFCPNNTANPPYYPPADTVTAATDHLTATNDGAHVLGATTTNVVDIQHSPSTDSNLDVVPSGACPAITAPNPLTLSTSVQQIPLPALGTAPTIDQIVASPSSTQAFITYSATGASGVLPLYIPSVTPGSPGTVTSVQIPGMAVGSPVAGIFSPDSGSFFVSTSGDSLIHQISATTLQQLLTLTPALPGVNNGPAVPAVFLAVKPRAIT